MADDILIDLDTVEPPSTNPENLVDAPQRASSPDFRNLWNIPYVSNNESFEAYSPSSLLRHTKKLDSANLAELDDTSDPTAKHTDNSSSTSTDRSNPHRDRKSSLEEPVSSLQQSSLDEDEVEDLETFSGGQSEDTQFQVNNFNLLQFLNGQRGASTLPYTALGPNQALYSIFNQLPFGTAPMAENYGWRSWLVPKEDESQSARIKWGFHTGILSRGLRLHNVPYVCRYVVRSNLREGLDGTWYGEKNRVNAANSAWNILNTHLPLVPSPDANLALENGHNPEFEALATDFFGGKEVMDPEYYCKESSGEIKDIIRTDVQLSSQPSTDSESTTTNDALTPSTSDRTSTNADEFTFKPYKINSQSPSRRSDIDTFLFTDDDLTRHMVEVFLMDIIQTNEVEEALLEAEKKRSVTNSLTTTAKVHDVDFRRNPNYTKLDRKLSALDAQYKKLDKTNPFKELANWDVYEKRTYASEPVREDLSEDNPSLGIETAESNDDQQNTTSIRQDGIPQLTSAKVDSVADKAQLERESNQKPRGERASKRKKSKKKQSLKNTKVEGQKSYESEIDNVDKEPEDHKSSAERNPKATPESHNTNQSIASDPRNYDFTDADNPTVNDGNDWEVVKSKSLHKAKALSRDQQVQPGSTSFQSSMPRPFHLQQLSQQPNIHQRTQPQSSSKLAVSIHKTNAHAVLQTSESQKAKPAPAPVQRSMNANRGSTKNLEQFHIESLNDFPAMPIPYKRKSSKSNGQQRSLPMRNQLDHNRLEGPNSPHGLQPAKQDSKDIEKGSIALHSTTVENIPSRNAECIRGAGNQVLGELGQEPRFPKSPDAKAADETNAAAAIVSTPPVLEESARAIEGSYLLEGSLSTRDFDPQRPEVERDSGDRCQIPSVGIAQQIETPQLISSSTALSDKSSSPSTHTILAVTVAGLPIDAEMNNSACGRYRSASTTERYFDPSAAVSEEESEPVSPMGSPSVESSRSAPVTRIEGEKVGHVFERLNANDLRFATPVMSIGPKATVESVQSTHPQEFGEVSYGLERHVKSPEAPSTRMDTANSSINSRDEYTPYPADPAAMPIHSYSMPSASFFNPYANGFHPVMMNPGVPTYAPLPPVKVETRVIAGLSEVSSRTTDMAEQFISVFSNGWSHQDLSSSTILNPSMRTHPQPGSLQIEFHCSYCAYHCYGTTQNPVVLCHGCGLNSNIRYCSVACLLAGSLNHSNSCMKHPEVMRMVAARFPTEFLYFMNPITPLDDFIESPEKYRQKVFAMYCCNGQFPELLKAWARKHNLARNLEGHDLGESLNKTGSYFIFKSRASGDGFRMNPDSTVICTIKFPRADPMKQVLTRCLNACFMGCNQVIQEFLFRFIRNCISDEDSFDCYPHTEERSVVITEFHHQFRREFGFDAAMQTNPSDNFEFQLEWPAVEFHLDELEMEHPMLRRWIS